MTPNQNIGKFHVLNIGLASLKLHNFAGAQVDNLDQHTFTPIILYFMQNSTMAIVNSGCTPDSFFTKKMTT